MLHLVENLTFKVASCSVLCVSSTSKKRHTFKTGKMERVPDANICEMLMLLTIFWKRIVKKNYFLRKTKKKNTVLFCLTKLTRKFVLDRQFSHDTAHLFLPWWAWTWVRGFAEHIFSGARCSVYGELSPIATSVIAGKKTISSFNLKLTEPFKTITLHYGKNNTLYYLKIVKRKTQVMLSSVIYLTHRII